MAAFRAGVEGAQPLLSQIETTTATAIVVGVEVSGDNALGAASRPTLYRPAVQGIWSGFHPLPPTPLDGGTSIATTVFVTTFSSPPSVPTLPASSTKLPYQVLWRAPLDQGYVIPALLGVDPVEPQINSLVLYANVRGGHTVTANVIWEEM